MPNQLQVLTDKHRRLNRLIDSCKSAGRFDEMKHLKRIRLGIKDALAAYQQRYALSLT